MAKMKCFGSEKHPLFMAPLSMVLRDIAFANYVVGKPAAHGRNVTHAVVFEMPEEETYPWVLVHHIRADDEIEQSYTISAHYCFLTDEKGVEGFNCQSAGTWPYKIIPLERGAKLFIDIPKVEGISQ
jgi:hypothetical protein